MTPRISPQVTEPLLFAHRGASADAPDNTMPAFEIAAKSGVNGIESDVRVTTDDVAVLAHDDNVGSLVRRRSVSRSAHRDLPGEVPTLSELYETVGTDFALSLDLKDAAAIDATVAAIREAGEATGTSPITRAWLCHPDFELLASWRRRWSDVRLVHSTRLDRLDDGPERHAARLFEAGIDAVNFRAPDWTGGLTTLYHRFGVYCFGWDAHLTRVAIELLDMGCDAIYSNHVDRLLTARRQVWGF